MKEFNALVAITMCMAMIAISVALSLQAIPDNLIVYAVVAQVAMFIAFGVAVNRGQK